MTRPVYEAVGYPVDHYDRASEATVKLADVGRLWKWVADFLREPGRKVVVRRVESGYRTWRGVWRSRRTTKVWEGRSGDPVPGQ